MRGIGTIANFTGIVLGSLIGMLCGNKISERVRNIIMQSCGISVIFIGASGAMSGMLEISDGALSSKNVMLVTLSLVIGGIIGELIDIEERLDRFALKLKSKIKAKGDSKFCDGFVTATLVVCVGAMAIVGPLKDGISGDASMLFVKTLLDFVIVVVLSAIYGIGVLFSAFPLLIYQGLITIFAVMIEPFMSESLISNLSCVGSLLVFGVGVNLTFGNKIKVGNMLPAFLIPVAYELITKML